MLCQVDSVAKGTLVLQPRLDSYYNLLEALQQRASAQDGQYVEIHKRLEGITKETLQTQKAVWHRTCYSNATNKDQIRRAIDRKQDALSMGSVAGKQRGRKRKCFENDEPSTSATTSPFTRSFTSPLDKDLCFILIV